MHADFTCSKWRHAQVEECAVRLLGQVEVGRWGWDTSVKYPFSALGISEPELAEALIRVGQKRHPEQVSARDASDMYVVS